MTQRTDNLKTELIDSLVALVHTRLSGEKAESSERFLRQFYRHVSPRDMLEEEPEDLFGAALSIWSFGRDRLPGTAKIRVYNPSFASTGWQSAHTVIEIVNDDMPFLVDSVTAALNRLDHTVHLVIHPIIHVTRTAKGTVSKLLGDETADKSIAESYMHLQISEQSSDAALAEIERELASVLEEVRAAVEDWRVMRKRMLDVIGEVEKASGPDTAEDIAEVTDFLKWIEANHFTFLGYREYDYVGTGKKARMEVVKGSGLGILRRPEESVFDGLRALGELPADIQEFLLRPRRLLVMKANRKSRVHRPVHLDAIGVKKLDKAGNVVGEHRFVGLFTSVAYNQSPREIPLLRPKVDRIVGLAGLAPNSHDGKALVNILETYPRDELLQSTEEELLETTLGILHLQERQRTAAFWRKDAFERFVSALVYVPRDHYTTELREKISSIMARAFNGRVSAFYTQMSDSVLARLHLIIATTRGEVPAVDREELEHRIAEASRSWTDKLQQALIEARGEERGNKLMQRYGTGFPSSYREQYSAHAAVFDIDRMEELSNDRDLTMNLFRPIGVEDAILHLKFFHGGKPLPLSDVMPMLENMGVRVMAEAPHEITPKAGGGSAATDAEPVWIHDFEMRLHGDVAVGVDEIREPFHDAFEAVWTGRMEDDGFNVLVLRAGLTWRQVSVLRAYAKYLRQAAFTFSQDYMQETMAANAGIAGMLVALFEARFDPATKGDRAKREAEIVARVEEALEAVSNLDQDRIIRRFLNLIQCTLRTNFFQPAADGAPKSYVSFKLDSQHIEELPAPRPLVEIWVYSPRVEAVHLRGGRVARGGIRWSDRREDFRTEILGLVKAQMVKNAVIVPVGSKGGFVVKRPPADPSREAQVAEAIECYKTLMRGMLDITDNTAGAELIPPEAVVRHDQDDPYLVVAADKGTATFSDIANGVSRDYGFWLDDAFASGGSAGYDHKKMGITAKGAWESVKRHFREIGTDIQTTDFTVAGVGDMSGDVFGNGMLLSKHIRLLGAFNHQHIFVDPNPDPAKSFAERARLFALPRSSWTDYDASLISEGGGIFDRSAKSIRLTPQIKECFGITKDTVTPAELMRAILLAKVDLLWFGGIGTYVKARSETSADAGDRANDALRIDGREVRAKVIGEGANLGVTQRGRIEFALAGGRLNTDAIDNSAGVDCSDHEVNIKILLGGIVGDGDMTMKQRDRLLEQMTDEVGELVLQDNYDQSQALTMAQAEGTQLIDAQARLMRALERSKVKLDRGLEYLPDDETLAERAAARQGLTRPEMAVLLSYAKMDLYDDLLASDLPDDPRLVEDLVRYFPARLHGTYRAQIGQHRLRREIIATYVTNSMINRVGATFVAGVREQTGDHVSDIARAYIVARDVFDVRSIWSSVEALNNKVPAAVQTAMLVDIKHMVERVVVWFLRNETHPLELAALNAAYAEGIAALRECLPRVLAELDRKALDGRVKKFVEQGVPEDLARAVAGIDALAAGCDIVRLAAQLGQSVEAVAGVYFQVGARFSLDWLRQRATDIAADSQWQKLAVSAVVDDFFNHQIVLAQGVLAGLENGGATTAAAEGKGKSKGGGKTKGHAGAADAEKAIDAWIEVRREPTERATRMLADIRNAEPIDLAMLAVANGQFRSLLAR